MLNPMLYSVLFFKPSKMVVLGIICLEEKSDEVEDIDETEVGEWGTMWESRWGDGTREVKR